MAKGSTRFYIVRQDTDEAYELSSTQNCTISEPAQVTNRRVESGKSLADNYYIDNRTVTFNGVITSIRNSSTVVDVKQWVDEIRELRRKDVPVLIDVYAKEELIPNCLIQNITLDVDNKIGDSGWSVYMVMKEVSVSERAKLVEIPEPKEDKKDSVEGKTSTSSNPTEEVSVAKTTLALSGLQSVGLVSPELIPPTTNVSTGGI